MKLAGKSFVFQFVTFGGHRKRHYFQRPYLCDEDENYHYYNAKGQRNRSIIEICGFNPDTC